MPITSRDALVHRAIREIWNAGDVALSDELFTADYVNHGGLIPDLVRGPEAIKISVVFYRRAFPLLDIGVDDLRTHAGIITLSWTARTGGPGPGPRSDRFSPRAGQLSGTTRIRCVDGKIAESWMTWDRAAGHTTLNRYLAA